MDLTRFNDLIDSKSLTSDYKLIEYNAAGTFIRVSLLDADLKVIKVLREVYYGVVPSSIGTIDTTIDTTKNIIIRKK